ncbi:hypothetical protein LJB83_02870, partial [Clostridia bacterium OttesenSCG-928-F22]|nr:hypothetical protein [Clostridia bacterium OttesenSCG-928-F22]
GRTARSGIYTEGSAIVTDASFHDNRATWKGGGRYKWADCKKMFDYGNTEACTSAILSLVSDLSVDYKAHYKADALASYIIGNYNSPSCFSDLIDSLNQGYKDHVANENRYNRYAPEITSKVKQLEHVIGSIENYLCYIYNSQQTPEQFTNTVDMLVTQTFAYYLSKDNQREALRKLFQLIAQKIISNIAPEQSVYFAKSLYGIDISNQVLHWVDENIENLVDLSIDQLIDATANLFVQLFPDRINVDADMLISIIHSWIAGIPYVEICDNLGNSLQISQIEKLCSNTLSYHLCFLLGNILDAIDNRTEELTKKLALLQKMIKYGVPSQFQILVCENLFDDRIIAKQLDEMLGKTPVIDSVFREYIITHRHDILKLLEEYPAYFSYKLRLYTRSKP